MDCALIGTKLQIDTYAVSPILAASINGVTIRKLMRLGSAPASMSREMT